MSKRNGRTISSNTTFSVRNRTSPVKIQHHEFLDVVDSPQAMTGYTIQPSSADTFTWLPAIASRYEQYRLESLTIRYVPSCATTTAGTVYLAIDLDCLDNPPTSPQEMSQFIVNVSAAPYDPMSMVLKGKDANRIPWHYTAHDGYPVVCDRKTYDIGTVYVLCEGAGGASIGRLYMDYTFTFTSPTIEVTPVTQISLSKGASGATSTPYLTSDALVINALNGSSLIEDAGAHSVTWTDHLSATHTGTARFAKLLRDFEGLITWQGQGGPYNSGADCEYDPIFPNVHTSTSASGALVPDLEGTWNASQGLSRVAGPMGMIQGGSVLTHLRKGEYLTFPQWKTYGTAPNSDGVTGLLITLAQMVTGGLASSSTPNLRVVKAVCLANKTALLTFKSEESPLVPRTPGSMTPESPSSGTDGVKTDHSVADLRLLELTRQAESLLDRVQNALHSVDPSRK